jgi:hypothetical protein
MPITRNVVDPTRFNPAATFPYSLRSEDFALAMQDVYDFLYDVNNLLMNRGLDRIDDMVRPAALSGVLSDMLTDSIAKHSRALTKNKFFNGHPDLLLQGVYPNNAAAAGAEGVEIKTTRKKGGAVDTHGARNQQFCVFVYRVDNATEPARDRAPLAFTEVYLNSVTEADFRLNPRGELGTRTATLHGAGLVGFRQNWIYLLEPAVPRSRRAQKGHRRLGDLEE